jgi:putative restriction endonuclease
MEQKIAVTNGLLLCANHHRLFDSEWITVTSDYIIRFADPEMRDGPYSEADKAASVALRGAKISCPADRRLWPQFPSNTDGG